MTNNLVNVEQDKIEDASTSKPILKSITHVMPTSVNACTADQQTILGNIFHAY